MCSDLIDLKETLHIFEEEHIDYLHIDMMDGTFVPNFGLGVDYIRGLRKLTKLPLDLHLMIKDPEYKFQWIGINPNDIVSIHYESTFQVQRALDYLQPYGCKRFLALNPATPLSSIEEVLDYIDGINLLMVNPGFSGQRIVPSTIRKAQKLMDYLHKENRDDIVVEVDGNITPEHGRILKNMGASMFVCGTSAIFKGDLNKYRVNIEEFRQSIR
jgi:ribulose-phosphate 3-epimerase